MTASALYAGSVMHRRLRPKQHKLRYSLFSLLLDLDELPGLDKGLRLFSRNRFNLFGFRDQDHAGGSDKPLRQQVESHLAQAGIDIAGGPIRLLTMPRILGYAFNPLSVYFCYRPDERLAAILYEVNNTFRQRHTYLIPVTGEAAPVRQHCAKALYVSPFIDMAMEYDFRILPPGKRLAISIMVRDQDGTLLTAAMAADRQELTDAALLRAAALYPLLTVKVIAGIHWEALKLFLKGVRLVSRPAPPASPISITHAQDAA